MLWGQKLAPLAFHRDDLEWLNFEFSKQTLETVGRSQYEAFIEFDKEERLECLISKEDDFKEALFFYLDEEAYKPIKAEFHKEKDENFALFHSKISTKSLKIKGLKSLNLTVLKRKYSLIVATRHDLFGGRFFAMLNAMYLAQKSGLKFGFIWHERIPQDSKEYFVERVEEFFEEDFLKAHLYNEGVCASYALPMRFIFFFE